MTIRFLRRERAVACPVHSAVRDLATTKLNQTGVFCKSAVIQELNFEAIEDAIRWDYIREFIQETHGCELVPLSESYFLRHQRQEECVNPAKFIASGHGKKTYGYAAVIPENDHLTIARIKQRKAVANGADVKFQEYLRAVQQRRGISLLEETPSPAGQHPAELGL